MIIRANYECKIRGIFAHIVSLAVKVVVGVGSPLLDEAVFILASQS